MAAISSNPIAASDGPAPASVRAPAHGADKSAGGQAFTDLLTGTSQQTPADSAPSHASAGTKSAASSTSHPPSDTTDAKRSKAAIGSSATAKNPAIATKVTTKKEKKAQSGQDRKADPAKAWQAKQSPQSTQTNAVAVTVAAQPSSTPAPTPTVRDGGETKNATPSDIVANGDTVPAVHMPPNSGRPTGDQQAVAGDDTQEPAQNSVQTGKDGSSTAATASQNKPKSTKAAEVLANLKPVANAATAQAKAVLAGTAQNSESAGNTAVSDDEKTGTDLDAAAGKLQSRKKPKDDPANSPDPASNAPDLGQTANPQTAAQTQSVAKDDDAASPAKEVRSASVSAKPAPTPSVAAEAPQNQATTDVKQPVDPDSGRNAGPSIDKVPADATPSKDKTAPSGKAPQPAPGAFIKAAALTMTGAQSATAAAANSKIADQTGGAQATKSSHDSGDKPAHVARPGAVAAAQPSPAAPASIHSATAPQPGVLPQTAAAFSGGTPAPGANPPAIGLAAHIAPAVSMPTPNLDVLAISIAARSLSGAKQFDIRLDPPELGSVQVRLSIDASGKTQAHMTADQPQTLALLQKDAPTLTQALRDAGLNVSQQGLNFSLRGQDRQSDARSGGSPGRRTNLSVTPTISASPAPNPISRYGAASNARVDIHV